MTQILYRYTFNSAVSVECIRSALLLAIVSVESLYGESQARLDIQHLLDEQKRACTVDASTRVGRDLNRLLIGYLRRELGETQFRVKRMTAAREMSGTAA